MEFSRFCRVIWEEIVSNQTYLSNGSITTSETEEIKRSHYEIRQHMIITYAMLLASSLVVYMTRTYGYFIMCLRIAFIIHNRLFDGISRAAMYFFNTNPSGRILNRFAKDINVVDSTLPATFLDVFSVRQNNDIFYMLIIICFFNNIYLCYREFVK